MEVHEIRFCELLCTGILRRKHPMVVSYVVGAVVGSLKCFLFEVNSVLQRFTFRCRF